MKDLLPTVVVIGLVAGCSVGVVSHRDVELLSIPSPLPTPVMELKTPPVGEPPEMPADRATHDALSLPPSVGHRPPPAVEDHFPPTPVEMARADLAHRLHTETSLVDVVEAVTREPDVEVMRCLGDILSEELWSDLSEVEWISLSVKGNVHHYVALGEVVLYCDE